MKSNQSLTKSNRHTYNAIFQHPLSHNLKWQEVHALLRHLGEVNEENNGNLKVQINGKVLILHPATTTDVSNADDVMKLRNFLKASEAVSPEAEDKDINWLLVIDHQEARIFRSEVPGSLPHQILPSEPKDYFRHAHNSLAVSRGKEKPDPNTFFEPVAQALGSRGSILIFGSGTGTSNEMDQFVAWLKTHHMDLSERVIGTVVVNESHLTENQLLAKARDFHKKYAVPR